MASRNERKRKAKAKREALERAVQEAFRLEAERKRNNAALPLETVYPVKFGGVAGSQRLTERDGKVLSSRGKRKFAASEPKPFEPLRHDDNASGYGQLRKRYI